MEEQGEQLEAGEASIDIVASTTEDPPLVTVDENSINSVSELSESNESVSRRVSRRLRRTVNASESFATERELDALLTDPSGTAPGRGEVTEEYEKWVNVDLNRYIDGNNYS